MQHFVEQHAGAKLALNPATLASFQWQAWPGNVRELKNAVLRALALRGPDAPEAKGATATTPAFKDAREKLLHDFERAYLEALLARHRGNLSAAAREAKLSRSYFYELLERHGLATAP